MEKFAKLYLDREKDIVVSVYKDKEGLFYTINTPNHHTGNLISNLAKVTKLKTKIDNKGYKYIEERLPSFTNGRQTIYVLKFGDIEVANIYDNGSFLKKAGIPAITKTLMSQTKDYRFSLHQTFIESFVSEGVKFHTDLHTHLNGILNPDVLISLGIYHQIRYPLYYVKKLNLKLTKKQSEALIRNRKRVSKEYKNSELKGKYLERKIDDNTYINFADLILNNIENSTDNINKIANSLVILKDSQAVFTNLEKLYLYRYVFTKGVPSEKKIILKHIDELEGVHIRRYLHKMIIDHKSKEYSKNSLFQDKLLWIGREYASQGVNYVEISNTSLVKNDGSAISTLEEAHKVLDNIEKETGVAIRFLAALRRMPLTIVKDNITPENYLRENLDVVKAIAKDPYVVGCDFVGEEINDIDELEPVIKELVEYAKDNPTFTIRIHAGENDSLRDNVANSIKIVKNSLANGQKMPKLRLGHGLYTADFNSKEGKQLIKDMKKFGVVLEFQLTSNVRLNNLTNIKEHPIKTYLKEGIKCVQGSDGGGLYGVTSIEEELSLTKLLELSEENLKDICNTEKEIIEDSKKSFVIKTKEFNKFLDGRSLKKAFEEEIKNNQNKSSKLQLKHSNNLQSEVVLKDKIKNIPLDKFPIVLAGGSFNSSGIITKMNDTDKKIVDSLLDNLDPTKCYFVIGNKLSGYEEYLVKKNNKFDIYAIVPSLITEKEYEKLKNAKINIVVSIESLGMGIYKSFNYEIFERIQSAVFVLDGNAAAINLIQEARNGKGKAKIFVSSRHKPLKEKAMYLKGYVTTLTSRTNFIKEVNKLCSCIISKNVKNV